ncbi:tetratricopeptide repeat protein [Occallatibacter riparius]|uniref:Tetratricopeptide repeat protein n=1 Tax=Occallatibacter riparius TaxID=1002689 RepID=A0A9J7BRV5_9BACT|nr:tetratricopeptide repeat protein [Occallatibacter riparius]UWZ85595.1 tetratricopeptide repeat protein [Occallatibacter riparius]
MKPSALLWVLTPVFCATAAQNGSAQNASAQASPSPKDLLQAATAAQQKGDLKIAIQDFRRALALQPDLVEAQIGLGTALTAAGDFDGAIDVDRHALQSAPNNPELRTGLGVAYYRKGDLPQARREFEAVHAAHPDDVNAAVLLAFTFNKLHRETDTVALLTPLEKGHESNLDIQYALGYALMMSGRPADGLARVEKVAAARHAADVWMLAASARFELKQFKESLTDARHALEANPSFPGVHTLVGQSFYANGNIEEAVREFQVALRQDPSDFTANLYLGIIRFDDHDLDSARPLLELALSIQPQHPLARLEVARLRNMQGDTTQALSILEDLVKSDPDWLDPHVDLAALYYKLHRPDDGQRERDVVKRLQQVQQSHGPRTAQPPSQ